MKRLWSLLASLKTTAWLLILVSILLLFNVVIPQAAVLGEDALRLMAEGSPARTFFLFTLGLGRLPTSPVFLGALGLFFLNLLAVLTDRTGATLRQVRMRDMSEEQVKRQTGQATALSVALPGGWATSDALRLLRGHGFKALRMGESAAWGVKNRMAPLGFLVFHASFFVLCLGGVLLFFTRSVGTVRLVEGQSNGGNLSQMLRVAPWDTCPPTIFELREVNAEFIAGEATELMATLRFSMPGGGRDATARINHPARLGPATVLVEEAGVAPELWLQDNQGYTVDRVSAAAATRGDKPTLISLDGGRFQVTLQPTWQKEGLPNRAELADLPVTLSVREGNRLLFGGPIRPGHWAKAGPCTLHLVRHRFWGGFRIVTERGGGLLISGFLLCVVGLLWRMLAFRREVFLSWGDGELKVAGRGEFFPGRIRDELESIVGMVADWKGPGAGPGAAEEEP